MNEKKLRVLFNIIPDPEVNKVDLSSKKTVDNIQNIVMVLKNNKNSTNIPFKRIRALEKVCSYN